MLDDISGGNVSFGTVLNAANVLKNGGALTSSGIGGELLGSAVDAIGQTTGIDVSGVAGVAFPKGGGGGGASTIAAAAALVGGASILSNAGGSGASTSLLGNSN